MQVCAENETKDKPGCLHILVFNHVRSVRQEIKGIDVPLTKSENVLVQLEAQLSLVKL